MQNLLSSSLLSNNIKIKILRTIILPIVSHGYETWSLTLRKEFGPTVFENSVLRRISGPKEDEVTGKSRKLYNEELNDLYYSPNVIQLIKLRRMRWAVYIACIACMGHRRGAYRVLVGKPEGMRVFGRPRCRWEDNIKIDIQEVGCGAWTGLIWLRTGKGSRHL